MFLQFNVLIVQCSYGKLSPVTIMSLGLSARWKVRPHHEKEESLSESCRQSTKLHLVEVKQIPSLKI